MKGGSETLRKIKRSEAGLLTAILNYLYALETTGRILHCDRLNSGKVFLPYTTKSGARRGRMIRLCREGTPDAFFITNPPEARMVWVECKTGDYKLNPEQVKFKLKVEAAGMDYIIARSIGDVERWLQIRGVV